MRVAAAVVVCHRVPLFTATHTHHLLELSQLGLTFQDILGPVTSPGGGVQGTVSGFSLRQLPAAIPAQVPLGTGCCLCCHFSLCSVGLSLLLTGVILTAFPDTRPAIKPPSQRPSLADQTQHPTPRQPHHVICATQSPQSLGKSKSLHVCFTTLPILLTEILRLRKEGSCRPNLTHSTSG